jgi:hypothetical protein
MTSQLTFQPVPPQSDLQSRIPTGRLAVNPKPCLSPIPAFGPNSLEYTRIQAEALELASRDVADSHEPTNSVSPSKGSYAGSGSYF